MLFGLLKVLRWFLVATLPGGPHTAPCASNCHCELQYKARRQTRTKQQPDQHRPGCRCVCRSGKMVKSILMPLSSLGRCLCLYCGAGLRPHHDRIKNHQDAAECVSAYMWHLGCGVIMMPSKSSWRLCMSRKGSWLQPHRAFLAGGVPICPRKTGPFSARCR